MNLNNFRIDLMFFNLYLRYFGNMNRLSGLFWGMFFIMLSSISAQHRNWDTKPLYYFQEHRNALGNTTAKIANVGVYPLTILEPICEFGIGVYKKDSLLKRKACMNGLSIAFAMGLSTLSKYTIARPRPYEQYHDLMPIAIEHTPSFPSGHTTAAFTMATNLSLSFKKWYVVVPAYTYASVVGFTRIYSGVHYPSDVLAGALLGTGSSLLTHWINKKLQGRGH